MKVLVTGGAGFIGSQLVDLLLAEGHTPIVLDNFSNGREENVQSGVKIYRKSLLSDKIERIFKKEQPDVVMHLAAQVSVAKSLESPAEDAAVNVLGTVKLLEYCTKYGVKKFIFSSSSAVYGYTSEVIHEDSPTSPISFYGTSKLVSETYIKLFNRLNDLPYTILRYANVYGPRQRSDGEGGVISIFIEQLLRNEAPVIFGDGNQTRDFVFVDDVARANLLAITNADNQIINIGTSTQTSVNLLCTLLSNQLHSSLTPDYKPKRQGDILNSHLSNAKALDNLKWAPNFNLISGLEKTVDFFKINNNFI
ncbi:NAD-dependent epimerase/dehydratase family protein [Rossellomorea aquimaris]|uniref:NAD-dependent epimerase/dehydratase family protein n=1 Tax=Rossellomorea aquimaris TaxID=189382 RepID=UPI0005C8C85E|nr:NAD-dependent epimerase/dehydratase family protein [Rossellomorea aquimaris]